MIRSVLFPTMIPMPVAVLILEGYSAKALLVLVAEALQLHHPRRTWGKSQYLSICLEGSDGDSRLMHRFTTRA